MDAEEPRTTLPPAQKVVDPTGVIVGTAGVGFTVTLIVFETAEVQPNAMMAVVNAPEVVTTSVWFAPEVGDQLFPAALDEVSVTLPPEQNVVGPPAEMIGVAGTGFTVTVVGAEVAVHPFSVIVTV